MDASSAATQLHRMPQVQHFMVDQIFHGIPGHIGSVKNAADHNGVMRRIIVAEAQAEMVAAPGHLRTRHQAMKKLCVQVFEDLLQVVMPALCAKNAFASTHLPDQVHLGGNILAAGKFAEADRVGVVDFFPVNFGNQDMQDGMNDRFGCSLQQIGEADKDTPSTQANGVVQLGEREELNLKFRQRRSRPQFPVGLVKNGVKVHFYVNSERSEVRPLALGTKQKIISSSYSLRYRYPYPSYIPAPCLHST